MTSCLSCFGGASFGDPSREEDSVDKVPLPTPLSPLMSGKLISSSDVHSASEIAAEIEEAFERGQAFERDGSQHHAAALQFKRCLSLAKGAHAPAWRALGQLYASREFDFGSALICFRHLVQLEPTAEHHLLLGLSQIALGKAGDALNSYYNGLRSTVTDAATEMELSFNVALVHDDLRNVSEAILWYERAISTASRSGSGSGSGRLVAQSQLALAGLHLERRAWGKALTQFEYVVARTGDEMDEATRSSALQSIEFCKRELEARML